MQASARHARLSPSDARGGAQSGGSAGGGRHRRRRRARRRPARGRRQPRVRRARARGARPCAWSTTASSSASTPACAAAPARRCPRGGATRCPATRRRRAARSPTTPRGGLALGALNGPSATRSPRRGNPLALGMSVRRDGARRRGRRPSLAAAFPEATGARSRSSSTACARPTTAWRLPPLRAGGPARRTLRRAAARRARLHAGLRPLQHRPAHLRQRPRARRAARGAWSRAGRCRVEELVLVGHSMGGLVARSACHYGERDGRAGRPRCATSSASARRTWAPPLEGAPTRSAGARPAARDRGRRARRSTRRSVGIKDLRFGSCAEEDWCDCDPDEFLRDRCQEVPFLPDADYYFVGATLPPDGPVGRACSATCSCASRAPRARAGARGSRSRSTTGRHLAGLNHFDLLNHPRGLRPTARLAQ